MLQVHCNISNKKWQ